MSKELTANSPFKIVIVPLRVVEKKELITMQPSQMFNIMSASFRGVSCKNIMGTKYLSHSFLSLPIVEFTNTMIDTIVIHLSDFHIFIIFLNSDVGLCDCSLLQSHKYSNLTCILNCH